VQSDGQSDFDFDGDGSTGTGGGVEEDEAEEEDVKILPQEAKEEASTSTTATSVPLNTSAPKLMSKISSALADLDKLWEIYKFIPHSTGIRPSPERLEQKKQKLAELSSTWKNFEDYIYHDVFGCPFLEMPPPDTRKQYVNM